MNLKLRLSLLLGLLLLAFLAALFVLHAFERQQSDELLARVREERLALLNRWLDTSGLSLREFADDYAQWNEMVRFVEAPDPGWSLANIEADLPGFNAQAAWVLRPDGSPVYSVNRLDDPTLAPPPLAPIDFALLVGGSARPHFFLEGRSGLLEVRGAPISNDGAASTPLHGWLLVARRWDDAYLKNLADLTESAVSLSAPDDPPDPPVGPHLFLHQSLDDWRGRPLRMLTIDYDTSPLHEVLAPAMFQARIFVAFGLLVITALGLSLQRWVLRPLNWISESLKHGDPTPIGPLLHEKSELGGVARLVESDFAQREALRRSEESLRHTLDEHERLGRDLHDGVIQSLYATGLGLAGIRALVHTDPAEAEDRLEQTRHALNETIRDVRNFINGLEPEALKQQTFTHAVEALIEFRKSVRPFHATIEIDEKLAVRLNHEQRVHALQITREAVSNALRHGQAAQVTIVLRPLHSRGVELSIADDGHGFDPAEAGNGGIGLQSFAGRARELDAKLSIESAAEKGTRVKLTFISTQFHKMNLIRILIVDDSELVRRGIKTVLTANKQSPLRVVGEAGTAAAAVAEAARLKPDIVLLDIRLPDGSGFEACREILRSQPETRVVVLTSVSTRQLHLRSHHVGRAGLFAERDRPRRPGAGADRRRQRQIHPRPRHHRAGHAVGSLPISRCDERGSRRTVAAGTPGACARGPGQDQQGSRRAARPQRQHRKELSGQRVREAPHQTALPGGCALCAKHPSQRIGSFRPSLFSAI